MLRLRLPLLCISSLLLIGLAVSTIRAVSSASYLSKPRIELTQFGQRDEASPRIELQQIAQPGEGFFPNPIAIPEFPEGVDWINTNSKLQLSDLKGKLVLLDFWTYCCINCMHILPTLDEIEKKYDKQLVVIGVHTAKFAAEKETNSIREAIQRYEIRHPVLNDAEHLLWNRLQIGSWPTLVLLDPQGRAIWANAGEIDFADLDRVMQRAVNYYQRRNEIDTRSVHFALESLRAEESPLKYPSKVVADATTNRLFVVDSNHNRILVTDLAGKLLHTIGRGTVGAKDGNFVTAEFNHPQGIAFKGDTLYVADAENHRIRVVDLGTETVKTIAGTGKQTHDAWFGANAKSTFAKRPTREPLKADLASPWDVLVLDDILYIAMAGTHQIWTMDLQGKAIGPYAGNGREDIVDGTLLPSIPYGLGSSSFAQPSGLTTDGKSLYVADSEGSSIRALPLTGTGQVSTLVGTSKLDKNRLFVFGSVDGPSSSALFQHPLGVAYAAGRVYVADTYNNSVREIDLVKDSVQTLVGNANESTEGLGALNQPSGLSAAGDQLFIADTNNHRILVFNIKNNQLREFTIAGLTPPEPPKSPQIAKLPSGVAEQSIEDIQVAANQAELEIPIHFQIPEDWKLNPDAPLGYVVIWKDATGKELAEVSAKGKFDEVAEDVTLKLTVPNAAKTGDSLKLQIGLTYYFCRADSQGLCLADAAIFAAKVTRGPSSEVQPIEVEVRPR